MTDYILMTEAAERTGRSVKTIEGQTRNGRIRTKKENGRRYVAVDDLDILQQVKRHPRRTKNEICHDNFKKMCDGYITLREAAELTGRSTGTINGWAYSGKINSRKERGMLMVLREEVLNYNRIAQHRKQDGEEQVEETKQLFEPMKLNEAKLQTRPMSPMKRNDERPKRIVTRLEPGYEFGGFDDDGNIVQVLKELPRFLPTDTTEELEYAGKILALLVTVRDEYNAGWTPNWHDVKQPKPNIFFDGDHTPLSGNGGIKYPTLFTFKDDKTRDLFKKNFEKYLQTIAILFP